MARPSRSGQPANWCSGPPKSRAARRIVGIPSSIITAVREYLALFIGPGAEALIFPGIKGGPLPRSNFNQMPAWLHAVRAIGAEGLHSMISGTPGTTSRQPAARA